MMPFTRCCRSPAYIELVPTGSGKILCNNPLCSNQTLAEFLINLEDSHKLWDTLTLAYIDPEKDVMMREHIAKSVRTGKYKNYHLKKLIELANKEVSFVQGTNNLTIK